MNNFLGWYGNVSQTRPVFGFSECLHVTTPTTSQLAWMGMTPCPNPLDPHSTWHACVSARLHAAWTPQLGMIANSFSQFHFHNFGPPNNHWFLHGKVIMKKWACDHTWPTSGLSFGTPSWLDTSPWEWTTGLKASSTMTYSRLGGETSRDGWALVAHF